MLVRVRQENFPAYSGPVLPQQVPDGFVLNSAGPGSAVPENGAPGADAQGQGQVRDAWQDPAPTSRDRLPTRPMPRATTDPGVSMGQHYDPRAHLVPVPGEDWTGGPAEAAEPALSPSKAPPPTFGPDHVRRGGRDRSRGTGQQDFAGHDQDRQGLLLPFAVGSGGFGVHPHRPPAAAIAKT